MEKKELLTSLRAQVSPYKSQEFSLPRLSGTDLSEILIREADGSGALIPSAVTIKATDKHGVYLLGFAAYKPQTILDLSFYKKESGKVFIKRVTPGLAVEMEKSLVTSRKDESKPRLWKTPLGALMARQAKREEDYCSRIAEIREKDISVPGLAGARVLTIDHTGCHVRSLGIIQLAMRLEFQLGKPLCQCFDLVCGQGDGAIIAGAIASGIPLTELSKWWLEDWRKVFNPNLSRKLIRSIKKAVVRNASGWDAKNARESLRRLFALDNGIDRKLKSVLCPLHITVTQASLDIHYHRSQAKTEIELYAVVEDAAITKDEFDQRETIKGESVFLGALEKNDDLGLMLSDNNDGLNIVSLGAKVRVSPNGAKNLGKLGHAADKRAAKAGAHFMFEKRREQILSKIQQLDRGIQYVRFECETIDDVVSNSPRKEASQKGIDSGLGSLSLPAWLRGDNRKQLEAS